MALTKVLITVKTYPTISTKYEELVCTAGFREDGTWIRIYPIPFRKKSYNEQYKKYDWIEIDLVKNKSDFRPESYRPVSLENEIKITGHIDTARNWHERKNLCLGKVYYNITELVAEAKNKNICTSLAVFKPSEIIDFIAEPDEREWNKKKLARLEAERRQMNLFKQPENPFDVVRKLPYKFRFIFKDSQGKESKMMIEDWETGQLYWNCFDKYQDEKKAIADVRKKYFDDFAKTKDLYFYLGTTQLHHYTSRNPFMIIGTFSPQKEIQMALF
ncbi:hypothetical protein A9P82_05755 [Arachidicoccus ginsenosidimutans]|uniref:hypothetical protein n=1 Tax=Arachidicoccus sp. BS20 TaxID=1850526 RepID=UPI0007F14C66|nr:hypothetical protein [Arachidicoccus sp. BS20]ANI88836.1 hypothetical protein A9P82_05755 [Arachidicoccus sp. BS20]